MAALICPFTFPSLSLGRSLQQGCGCCSANHIIYFSKEQSYPCLAFPGPGRNLCWKDAPEGIRPVVKGMSSFASGNWQKLNAQDGSCPKSRCCPGLSRDTVLLCLSPVIWAFTGDPSACIFSKVAGLQPYISDRYCPTLTWNQSLVASSLLLANHLPAAAP